MDLHKQVIIEQQNNTTYSLTLQQIVKDNKITNFYQILALSILSEYFKNKIADTKFLEGPIPYDNFATSSEKLAVIKSLSQIDQVNLAQYLLDLINLGKRSYVNTRMDTNQWINYVLGKQD